MLPVPEGPKPVPNPPPIIPPFPFVRLPGGENVDDDDPGGVVEPGVMVDPPGVEDPPVGVVEPGGDVVDGGFTVTPPPPPPLPPPEVNVQEPPGLGSVEVTAALPENSQLP